ncbi:MAG: 4-hydroxythreonine-4-phosphate dehydrogenase PdxA [Pseudomonadota bacterium]
MSGAPIAISSGDPAGIGPEIAAKAWEVLRAELPILWIGDPAHLPHETNFKAVDRPDAAAAISPEALPVLALDLPGPARPGEPDPAHAAGVIEAIETGARLAQNGAARALVTAPISKKALIDGAGFAFPGHTEFLADLAGGAQVVMMLAGAGLRVVPTTIHVALAEVPRLLSEDLIVRTVEITSHGLTRDFGIAAPRIAVLGLNPHAGEGGAMGKEDIEIIGPAIASLQAKGHAVTGPHPADTMFHPAARDRYDVAVAMYHDQALVPLKTIAFDEGVNVTLGLPFIRTSPDHGTAFDIAGSGTANPSSMVAAIRLAADMAKARG